ncbi:MAG: aminotransferase class I/II-fold pyridoxal phosphate-dependent enzyme [Bradymonadia bacterium]
MTFALRPSPGAERSSRYQVPRAPAPIDLHLDGNEGATPSRTLYDVLGAEGTDPMRRYPDTASLEAALARRHGVDAERVVVTAGADETIDRACRALLAPGRNLVLPVPTFEMIARYARLSGGEVRTVAWTGSVWPRAEVLAALDADTAMVAIVTPNNPTGAVATLEDVRAIAEAAPHALVMLDHAYIEFAGAEHDLTTHVLDLPNVLVVRTVSKAWGLAGLRVGYGVGDPRLVDWLRACGAPYPVSGPSLALARAALQQGDALVADFVSRVVQERESLQRLLTVRGAQVTPSHANFVFARVPDAVWLRDAMAGFGIGIRAFPGRVELDGAVRVTCPGDAASFQRLAHALDTALAPEALLFDVDGVLVDVSASYRLAIEETCRSFGVEPAAGEVAAIKAAGNANNDWDVTRRVLAQHGVEVPRAEVVERFEALYQGTPERPGLRENETLRVDRGLFARLAERCPLGLVTGRPRRDLSTFLDRFELHGYFATTVCMEDAPLKPDPAPLRLALSHLGVRRAWFFGDTPDDARSARAAGVLPIGVLAPGEVDPTPLHRAGAGRVLDDPNTLETLLP